jgi:hypothetical protein
MIRDCSCGISVTDNAQCNLEENDLRKNPGKVWHISTGQESNIIRIDNLES